jgi:hypothetical protein
LIGALKPFRKGLRHILHDVESVEEKKKVTVSHHIVSARKKNIKHNFFSGGFGFFLDFCFSRGVWNVTHAKDN